MEPEQVEYASTCGAVLNERMQDRHSCSSHGHETQSKRILLSQGIRSRMRRCLVNFSDMNVQATGIAAGRRDCDSSGWSHILRMMRDQHPPYVVLVVTRLDVLK